MNPILAILLALAVYWLVVFVGTFITVEYAQSYLYDEVTPARGAKIAVGSLILAALLVWARPRYDTMFTSGIGWTVVQAIVWFAVFVLILRFHPVHAIGISLVAFFLLSGMATLAYESFSGSNPSGVPASRRPSQPLRRSTGPTLPSAPAGNAPAAAAAPATAPAAGGR